MNKPIDNEQAWDAQIEADLNAGKLNALIEAARDEAEDAHAVNKPIDNEMFMGRTSSTEVVQLAIQILKLVAQGMTTSNEATQKGTELTGDAGQGPPDVLLERLIMVTLQAATLHESLKDLIEMRIADNEADGLT